MDTRAPVVAMRDQYLLDIHYPKCAQSVAMMTMMTKENVLMLITNDKDYFRAINILNEMYSNYGKEFIPQDKALELEEAIYEWEMSSGMWDTTTPDGNFFEYIEDLP